MSNDIVVTWTSDQRKLIEDMQKQILLLQQQVPTYGKVTAAANKAGQSATKSLADQKAAALSLDLQKRTAIAKNLEDEKKAAQQSLQAQKAAAQALDLQRRIALDENRKATKAALDIERAAAARSLAEQKSAASSLRLQKAAALADQQKDERSAAAKSLAEQKAAAQSLALQKATAIHEEAVKAQNEARKTAAVQTEAAVQSLADQKKAALSLDLQRREAIAKNLADEKAAAASSLQSQKEAAQSLDLQRRVAVDDKMKADKSAGEVVRRSLMTEQQQARQVYRERMRHLFDLRKANAINSDEYIKAAQRARNEMEKASNTDMSSMWNNGVGAITSYIGAISLMTAGIRLARGEWQNFQDVQKAAHDATMTYAEARAPAVQNLDESMTGAQFDSWVMSAAKKTGQSPTFLARAAGGVLGAKGKRSAKEALDALAETVPMERYNAEELKHVAGAVLQQQTVDKGASFKEVLGQQVAAKVASRVESSGSFAQYMTFGAIGASAHGDSSKEWYQLASYLANMGGDPTGQTSGTGAVNWQKQMMELDAGMKLGGDKDGLGGNTMERLRSVARNPKFSGLRDQLKGAAKSELAKELGLSGGALTARARNYGAQIQILNNDPTAWAELEGVGKMIPDLGPGSAAFVDKQVKDLSSPAHDIAVNTQKNASVAETLKLGNTLGARTAAAKKGLQENLEAAGVGLFNQTDAWLGMNWYSMRGGKGNAPEEIQAEYQRKAATGIRNQSGWFSTSEEDKKRWEMAAKALEDSAAALEVAAKAFAAQKQLDVNVNMGGAGEKAADPPSAGLGGGFHHMVPGGRF